MMKAVEVAIPHHQVSSSSDFEGHGSMRRRRKDKKKKLIILLMMMTLAL